MAISWNEIKDRALHFSKEWKDTVNEDADAKPFLDAFFDVFGISRKKVGTFEHKVKKLNDTDGYIDLLWKGVILIEMKSRGKDLGRAHQQAIEYAQGLKIHEVPKYILVSDFHHFKLYDTEDRNTIEFTLPELINNVHHFGVIAGYEKKIYKEQDPVNIKAAELMGHLHDQMKAVGYTGSPLEVYLVRILFCLFAEDTTIFDKQQFQNYITDRTAEDGSDLAAKLHELFHVLNTPRENRLKNLDEQLNEFPYVNGRLFEDPLPTAGFDTAMRKALLECCYLDWSKISPAIFGSMFQSVMDPKQRRSLGAHYTSEKNILKLIKPLFLDELYEEFEKVKDNPNKLNQFHKRISELKFLDPACGCGNFLVITYRELRQLELKILKALYKNQQATSLNEILWLDVDMMYGIEYEEFPARIAEVALWLIDHQMNMQISSEFGDYFVRLPLKKSAKIVNDDALNADWNTIVNKEELSYIIGNPPFIGSKLMKQTQRDQITTLFENADGSGVLDYVTGWYIKSAKFIQNTRIKVAFVSTNSIVQGEQTSILWGAMLKKYGIKIHFAHRTFKWSNEAKGNAAVYCVIVGFANFDTTNKSIYEYEDIKGEAHRTIARNINPYLIDAKDIFVSRNNSPLCSVPQMFKGSQPTDGGNLLFSEAEKNDFINKEPNAEKYIKPFISAHEFINGEKRYCLWLIYAEPSKLKELPHLLQRIEAVRQMRLKSSKQATVKWANQPTLFTENRQPESDFILVPRHSSENRKFIPIGFFNKDNIAADSCLIIPNGKIYHFGVLTSSMHMAWVKNICGRIKSDYRYSNEVVYTNYPWPENPSEKQVNAIEQAAQKVLDTRAQFPNSSLADLYDPLTMPPALVKAHNELDKAVDLAYRPQPFTSEAKRMEFLFELYEKYTSGPLFQASSKKGKRSKS